MRSPLDGIRILDMTCWQNGPWGTVMLSDLGADVIKIEDPVNGDPGRVMRAAPGRQTPINAYFETMNRNKRSITLNLKSQEGRDVFYTMVKTADAVVQNFRLGVVEKLKVDYETCRKINPKIVYASVTGLGDKGPDAHDPVFDILGQARGGFTWMTSRGEPQVQYRVASGLADQTGAIILAHGMLAAFVARERFGVGQHVQTSQLGGQLTLQAMFINMYLLNKTLPGGTDRRKATNVLWNLYKCSDDNWISIGCIQSDRYWKDFVEALGAPRELLADERYNTHLARMQNCEAVIKILDPIFATKTRAEWLKALKPRGIVAGPVQGYPDLPDDPQIVANEYFVELDHPTHGKIREVGPTVKLSETPAYARTAAPEFGEHTESVLQEYGYTWEQIAGFREKGVV